MMTPKTMMMKNQPEAAGFNSSQLMALRKLVAQGENQVLEFKRKAAHPEKIIRELVAFANSNGGTLLIGVSDEGTIPGVKFPEEEIYAIRTAAHKFCRPAIKWKQLIVPVSPNRFVISLQVIPTNRKPHFIVQGLRKESYIRLRDMCIRASREMIEILRRKKRNNNIQFTYGDLEQQLIRHLDVHKTISLPQFIELSGLNRYKASNKLIKLVLANVLRITPNEKGDQFSLAFA